MTVNKIYFGSIAALLTLSGCVPQKNQGPSVSEETMRREVAELRSRLAETNRAAAQSKAQADTAIAALRAELAAVNLAKEKVGPAAAAPASELPVADLSYAVLRKVYTPGQLIPAPTANDPRATRRILPKYEVYFKGSQSGKEYPVVEVRDGAYGGFTVEQVCPPQAIIAARKPVASGQKSDAKKSQNSGVTLLSEEQARAIFGG